MTIQWLTLALACFFAFLVAMASSKEFQKALNDAPEHSTVGFNGAP